MKILYFSRDYTPHDYRFLEKLAETNHRVYYLRLEQAGVQIEDRPLPPAVEIIPWSAGVAPARLQDGPRLVYDLRRILNRVRPDLVHAGPVQRPALLAALAGARPLVSMSWGYDLLQDAERSRWWRAATRFTLRHSAAFVGDCETIRRLAIGYGMASDRIVTFPWGVNLEHFSLNGRRAPGRGEMFTLLSTRSWAPIYGVETIARAFVRVAKEHPELRLLMTGGGPLAGRLRELLGGFAGEPTLVTPDPLPAGYLPSTTRPLPGRVVFPGLIRYTGLPRCYRSADLYVSASHSDGSSISLLEAMACGCPALVSDIPGNREWIVPGENGWLFPPGDAEALAAGIENALANRSRLAEMGSAARRTVEARADWERNFPRLLEAYQIALSR